LEHTVAMKNAKLKMKNWFEIGGLRFGVNSRITKKVIRHLPLVICIFSLLIVPRSPLHAQNESAQNIIEKISKKYETIIDATLEFSQTIRLGIMKREQSFEGTLTMKREKKYRIELEQQTIVTNGITVWSYSKPNQQVLIDSVKDDPKNFTPEKILLHAPENYYSTLLKKEQLDGKQMNVVKLTPKDDRSFISTMKLWIDATDSLIKKAEITDVNENFTQYIVKKISLNKNINDSTFTFSIPENIEVIDLR